MWTIVYSAPFGTWMETLDDDALEALYKVLTILRDIGPLLGRPHCDAVAGSRYPNMKELRIQNKKRVYRVLFIFDPARKAVLLAGADKRGEKKFYEKMIRLADSIYASYLRGAHQ